MDLLDRMLGSDRWLTNLMLETGAKLSDEQLDQEFDIGNKTIRATLAHLVSGTDYWVSTMDGQPRLSNRNHTPPELVTCWNEVADRFDAFARRVQSEGRLDDTFVDAWDSPQTYGSVIVHLITHQAIHRSEFVHMAARLGHPGFDDFDPTIWEHKVIGVPGAELQP